MHGMDAVIMTLLGVVGEGNQRMRAKLKLLLTSPQPTVEVRQAFDEEPGTLLHMSQMPLVEDGVGFARLQEQLGAGIEGRIVTEVE